MTAETLAPIVNDLNRPFWGAAQAGVLVLPHCTDTGRSFWPPSPMSPFTGGAVDWRPVAPEGTLVATVTYARVFQQLLADRMPYSVALVELSGGVRLQVHAPDPSSATPGALVRVGFAPLAVDTLPVLMLA